MHTHHQPCSDLDALHAPLVPILRLALAQQGLSTVQLALDVACGPGLKSAWLLDMLHATGRVVGVDLDQMALRTAAHTHDQVPCDWVAGDALTLPLRTGCADLAWCIAALGLVTNPLRALHELRRVLRPGGTIVIATGEQSWVRIRSWPPDLGQLLTQAYAHSLATGAMPALPDDGLGDELCHQLTTVGFRAVHVRAFLLPPATPAAPLDPYRAELALCAWPDLRTRIAPLLPPATILRCDELAATDSEPDLAPVLLLATATA